MNRGLCLVLMAAGAVTLHAGAESPAPAVVVKSAPATAGISSLTQLALHIGRDGKLPLHLVNVLGLGTHAVVQGNVTNGRELHGRQPES